jgi:hypothetical protein
MAGTIGNPPKTTLPNPKKPVFPKVDKTWGFS